MTNTFKVVGNEVVVSKAFMKKSMVIGSKDFYDMAELRKVFPNHTITTTKSNTAKQPHSRLTIARMDFCIKELTNNNKEKLDEFKKVKAYFKGTHYYYLKVKEYFLAKYPNYDSVPYINDSEETNNDVASIDESSQAKAESGKSLERVVNLKDSSNELKKVS